VPAVTPLVADFLRLQPYFNEKLMRIYLEVWFL
jgi:hypothetical protein